MRLIDADKLKEMKCKWCMNKRCKRSGWECGFINLIDSAPTEQNIGAIRDAQLKNINMSLQGIGDSLDVLLELMRLLVVKSEVE